MSITSVFPWQWETTIPCRYLYSFVLTYTIIDPLLNTDVFLKFQGLYPLKQNSYFYFHEQYIFNSSAVGRKKWRYCDHSSFCLWKRTRVVKCLWCSWKVWKKRFKIVKWIVYLCTHIIKLNPHINNKGIMLAYLIKRRKRTLYNENW